MTLLLDIIGGIATLLMLVVAVAWKLLPYALGLGALAFLLWVVVPFVAENLMLVFGIFSGVGGGQ
jgi:hypothetical protein